MIVAVSGWRKWDDVPFVRATLDRLLEDHLQACTSSPAKESELCVRLGDANGVDLIAKQWCLQNLAGYGRFVLYEAPWVTMSRGAGPERNRRMLMGGNEDRWEPNPGVRADLLLAFPEPGTYPSVGSGTWGCVGEAWRAGIEVSIPAYKTW